jgi:hypothetical protein
MKLRTLARATVAAGAAAALLVAAQPAQAADTASTTVICSQYIKIESIQVPAWANCMLDAAGTLIIVVGNCVYYYDPLFSPIPSNVVPATVGLVNCIA